MVIFSPVKVSCPRAKAHLVCHLYLLPPQGFWPQRAKNPRRHLRTPHVIEESERMYRYCIGISGRYMEKNLDLIACTPARHRRFSRKCSWEASKETRARGLVRSASGFVTSFSWLVQHSSVPKKRLCLPTSFTISARSNKFASKWPRL